MVQKMALLRLVFRILIIIIIIIMMMMMIVFFMVIIILIIFMMIRMVKGLFVRNSRDISVEH